MEDFTAIYFKLQECEAIRFQVKNSVELGKVMKIFQNFIGCDNENFRYLFNGQRILQSDTPSSLKIHEGDTVEIYRQQTGGANYEE